MKSAMLKSAVAGALILAGANAMALAPSAIDSSVVNVYIGGATSTDNAMENLAKLASGSLCQSGSLDVYYWKNSSGAVKTKVMFCTAAFSGTGITSGTTKIAIFKESNGGSANGIHNVAAGVGLSFVDFYSGSSNVATACATATTPSDSGVGDFAAYKTRDCGYVSGTASTVNLATIAPNAGVSDIDPGTFAAVGTGSGVTAGDVSTLTHKRQAIAVTFNPIVSTPLFSALQQAQGLTGGDTTSINTMASIPTSIVRGIFTGRIIDAGQVYINGTALSTYAGTDTNIYVCRRGNTSGTMASFKIQYLNEGCLSNSATTSAFVKPDASHASCENAGCSWSSGTYGADFVFAGSGSGDVRSCVDYHSSQGQFAVGTVSTEAKPSTSSGGLFRYVKVDSAEPTLKAVMEGRYDFFTEMSFNDKLSTSSAEYTLFNKIYSTVGTGAALKKVNESWQNASQIGVTVTASVGIGEGDTGILDLPASGNIPAFPVTAASVRTSPINGQTRTADGKAANACNRTYMWATPF